MAQIYNILVPEWISEFFKGKKKPSPQRIKKNILDGLLPGKRVGNTNIFVVHCDRDYNPIQTEDSNIEKPSLVIENEIAKKILEKTI